MPKKVLEEKFRNFVEDDVGQGDLTTLIVVPSGTIVEAKILAKEHGIIAGIEETSMFLESFGLQATPILTDGSEVKPDQVVLRIDGDARTLLSIERTMLNLLSRMSGIATATNRLVKKVKQAGFGTRVACTRKVAPGLSYFDKKAVRIGGGDTHRLHLDDMILIKDNHLTLIEDIKTAVKRAREAVSFSKKIEVEVSTTKEALEAVEAGADIVMLDNFSPGQAKSTVELMMKKGLRNKALVESSGKITEKNILEFAATGVDIISLGEITDSAKALDISLEIVKIKKGTT
ncbi:MAG: carboxylating nicotinate-nucleotide diphosphorylase [Candidatus Bathyarchaeota archaeon]|nr:MAG: carboxylating nicotinate-nucleotide diphosphorylase [Candidatus Bathyarchaeota archaeon]